MSENHERSSCRSWSKTPDDPGKLLDTIVGCLRGTATNRGRTEHARDPDASRSFTSVGYTPGSVTRRYRRSVASI